MRSLVLGALVLFIVGIVSYLCKDWSLILKISGMFGVIAFLLSALLSGALLSGDRIRANVANEDTQERNSRQRWAVKFFLFGLPNVAGALICSLILTN